jgi:RimJ/RimL family protein N-acetyltransferase
VRRARPSDARRLWRWANDAETRTASVRTDLIPFEVHLDWFGERLVDRSCLLLIGWNGAGALGQVRFDTGPAEAEVSISVAPEHRGTVGGLLLAQAIRQFARVRPGVSLAARIKPENEASRRLFEGAGFAPEGERDGLLRYAAPAPLPSWRS